MGRNHENWVERNDFSDPNYSVDGLTVQMMPIAYESLKGDQEYLYFLKRLKNRLFYFVKVENKSIKKAILNILEQIDQKLESLD